jgi:hypothetical protein
VANHARQEFWQPPTIEVAAGRELSEACDECGTEFIVGARFCHCCGTSRPGLTATHLVQIPGLAELTALGKRLGLTMPALIAFLFGMASLLGALAVGVVFTARTALDWQAIQLWRIECLLAAIAGFSAGLLLKRSSQL